jgi:hypothetical protein
MNPVPLLSESDNKLRFLVVERQQQSQSWGIEDLNWSKPIAPCESSPVSILIPKDAPKNPYESAP